MIWSAEVLTTVFGDAVGSEKYWLAGQLSIEGGPGRIRRVVAVDRRNMKVLGATMTDQDGKFDIKGLPFHDAKQILVIVSDKEGKYNSECADWVTLEKMER